MSVSVSDSTWRSRRSGGTTPTSARISCSSRTSSRTCGTGCLRDAVAFYRKLEGLLAGQADARSRRALGRAYEEVGDLTDKIGSIPEALAIHRKALEVRRALAPDAASDPTAKADVGRSLIAIGILLNKVGQHDQALRSYEDARSELGGLVGTGPGARRDPWRYCSELLLDRLDILPDGQASRGHGRPRAGACDRGVVRSHRIRTRWMMRASCRGATTTSEICELAEGKWPEALESL